MCMQMKMWKDSHFPGLQMAVQTRTVAEEEFDSMLNFPLTLKFFLAKQNFF